MPDQKDFDLTTKEGRKTYREALQKELPELGMSSALEFPTNELDLRTRIEELEEAIRVHRTKVQLVQTEDMELWAHLNDGEQ